MATMWEIWTTEARAEGRAEGKAEGKAEVFLRLVAQRLGEVPEDMAARVRAAGAEDIDSWIDAVLDGRTVDEALNRGTAH